MDFPNKIVVNKFKDNVTFEMDKNVRRSVDSLGISTDLKCVGWTVAVPDSLILPARYITISKTSILGKSRLTKYRYRDLTPYQQYHFLTSYYLPSVVCPHIAKGVGVPELTKSGNVHLHMICQDELKTSLDLWTLRKSVDQCHLARTITKGVNTARLNYIHYLEDVNEWILYMMKDLCNMTMLPNFKFTDEDDVFSLLNFKSTTQKPVCAER